jgi:hypothetical protein
MKNVSKLDETTYSQLKEIWGLIVGNMPPELGSCHTHEEFEEAIHKLYDRYQKGGGESDMKKLDETTLSQYYELCDYYFVPSRCEYPFQLDFEAVIHKTYELMIKNKG